MTDAAEFLGLPFTTLPSEGVVAAVDRAARGDRWRYVVTPNAAHLARLDRGDAMLVAAYAGADFCVLDSRVIALFARLVGLPPPPVVPGSDLVEQIFRRAVTPATSLCIIGGEALAIASLRGRFGFGALHHRNPPRGFWRDPAEVARIVDFVVASRADYTLLVVGSPQQEILAARIAQAGGARGVGLCAGAAIDFLTGRQRRAPRILQRLALEWAFRLALEPRRLAYRYFVESPQGILVVLRAALRHRAQPAVTAR